jgi:hypothetical protein
MERPIFPTRGKTKLSSVTIYESVVDNIVVTIDIKFINNSLGEFT